MDSMTILYQQIIDEITETRRFLVRLQDSMPAPAFNHPAIEANWKLVVTSNPAEIAQYESMAPTKVTSAATEAEFFAQYANQYRLDPTQYNTSPSVALLPARAIEFPVHA